MIVYYKIRQILLQNTTAILLQNAQLLQIASDSYYKMRHLLQIATVHKKP